MPLDQAASLQSVFLVFRLAAFQNYTGIPSAAGQTESSGPVRSGPVQSGPIRSTPVRPGSDRTGPDVRSTSVRPDQSSIVELFFAQMLPIHFSHIESNSKPAIAQLVEHLTVETCSYQMVPGSIPSGRICQRHCCHFSMRIVIQNDPGRTRTCNPRLRRPMPYPLGHGASAYNLSSNGYWF